jgi:hypothetical protein
MMSAAAKGSTASRDLAAELVFLTRALKAPTLRESAGRLADRARAESWTHESYLDEEYTSNRAKRLVGRGA